VSLAPCFGIRLWGLKDTAFFAAFNFLQIIKEVNVKKYLGKYKRQYYYRLPLESYKKETPLNNYIFHISTLWQSDQWIKNDEFVNRKRANFIEACKSIPEIRFEGGFYFNGNFPLKNDFKQLVINDFMPFRKYLEKTKKSMMVFNTPAWFNCNGWKLGEYLALGKAIISTQLMNDLPEPLVHGENIHFVTDDHEDIKDSILRIYKDKNYREKISEGAHQYYLRNATPVKSLELLGITG
jgi:glycosyltransferase involved in cell wall biosynthesis